MKYITGIALGAGLLLAGTAFASTVVLNTVQFVSVYQQGNEIITKYVDTANGTTCYTDHYNSIGGISCVR